MAVLGGDAFGVKLDAIYHVLGVLKAHDNAIGGVGGYF